MLLQGSTSGLLLVLRFFCVDLELVMVWSCQCTFQSPSSNFSVYFWVVFLVRWVGYFARTFQIMGFVLVATFLAKDWNLHIIVSHVVGAIVGVS